MFGKDADGDAFRVRTSIDVATGEYEGFSVVTRLFASQGAGGPNGGTLLGNSGKDPTEHLSVGLPFLYGKMAFQSSATTIKVGQTGIDTPFSDVDGDYGDGISIRNSDLTGISVDLQAYGVWGLDNANSLINTIDKDSKFITQPFHSSGAVLAIAGVSGDPKELGIGFNLWAAHSPKVIDFLVYGDAQYSIAGVTIGGKVVATQVNVEDQLFSPLDPNVAAKLRGIYNVQVAYSGDGISAAAGWTGSFGDGYGALFNNTIFNVGGQFWWDTVGGNNGPGILGAGGMKNPDGSATTLQVGYVSLKYSGIKSFSVGLDYAYVGGKNNFSLMSKGKKNHNATSNRGNNMNATFHEVSATAKYAFSDKLSLAVTVGSTFGDLAMGRARARLNYSF